MAESTTAPASAIAFVLAVAIGARADRANRIIDEFRFLVERGGAIHFLEFYYVRELLCPTIFVEGTQQVRL